MYGYANREISPKLAELRADPWIFKASNLLKNNQISDQYQKFQDKALVLVNQMMMEEEKI
jgi:hypothetical protein